MTVTPARPTSADPAAGRAAAPTLGDSWRITRENLRVWAQRPGPILTDWLRGSFAAAMLLLAAVFALGAVLPAGSARPILDRPPLIVGGPADVVRILGHNLLVLLLHECACVAGFIAGARLPLQANAYHGRMRTLHDRGATLAIGLVALLTAGSLVLQAATIGTGAAQIAGGLHTSPVRLLTALLPHAVPELTALFLPLAAWLTAARRGDWDQLLAAVIVTTVIAVPALLVCATWEVYGAPHLVQALTA